MLKGVSVIISTFNGANKLQETLKHLALQKANIPWEIVLVDNASTDQTKELAEQIWNELGNQKIPFSTYYQPIPGKSHAQELGYEKAAYEYLLIVDDDNWLHNSYVQTSYEIMESNSEIGGLGGWCEAEFEGEKPDWFNLFANNFAVSRQGEKSGDITDKKGCLYGAGMVIRKSHWLELKEKGFVPILTCRKGKSLSSGGDTEYSYALRLLGYRIWFDERLYFKHYMPVERMNLNYIKQLRKAMSEVYIIMLAYLDEISKSPANRKHYLLKTLKEIKLTGLGMLTYKTKSNVLYTENTKSNLRRLYALIFGYKKYLATRKEILNWVIK